MLCLSRLVDQALIIGEGADAVKVIVMEAANGKARFAIEAPKHIRVDREEVRRRMEAEKVCGAELGGEG